MAAGYQPATNGITFPACAWMGLPPAAASAGLAFFVADTPSGASLVVSDGASWRVFARGVVAQSYTLTDADRGVAVFNYALGAPPVPAITLEDPSGQGMLTLAISKRTASQLVVQVNRGQVFATLAAMTGLNPFVGGSTTGVIVHLVGVPIA